MNYPSVKTITTRLAEPLRKQGLFSPKRAASLVRVYITSAENTKEIAHSLHEINALLGGYGVEVLTDNGWDKYYANAGILYVNMGDTYAPTVCFDTRSARWMICSWGGLVEGNPKRFADK